MKHKTVPATGAASSTDPSRRRETAAADRQHEEEAVRDREGEYDRLLNEMESGFALHELVTDPDGTPVDYVTLEVNPAFERALDIRREDVVGKKASQFLPPAELRNWLEIFGPVSQGGPSQRYERYSATNDRYFRWYAYSPTPGQFATLFEDFTERKRAEEALRASERLYRGIGESIDYGVWVCAPDGRNTYASDSFLKLVGISQERCSEFGWGDVLHPEDAERTIAAWKECVRTGGVWDIEHRFRGVDGKWHPVLARGVPVRDEQGHITCWAGINLDLSRIRKAEEEQARLGAQLQQAQKMESVGRLAGGVAHDFNNMLGVILGHAELALAQVDVTQPLHADLEEIRKAAMRSADLTRQLLAFARRQTVAPRVLDLNDTVASMIHMLRRLIGENVDVQWQPAADLWPVNVDPSQIDQILANLCVNARDAISGVGKVTIETGNTTLDERYCAANAGCAPGDYVLLAVSDNGCGMDKETLSLLFEPFFTTKVMGKGTGLGLAMVYGIVTQNSGFINVYSEPNLGTTFKVYLPRHVGKTAQASSKGDARPAPRGRETILLVEDEPAILTLTKRMLEHQGYTVLAASTPGGATSLAREYSGEIHLLMTDVVMPEMNGRVLAKNLLSLYPHLKRLFMSGYTADVIAHHGVLDEGVHFIQKPFFVEDVATKVRAALDAQN